MNNIVSLEMTCNKPGIAAADQAEDGGGVAVAVAAVSVAVAAAEKDIQGSMPELAQIQQGDDACNVHRGV